MGSVLGIGKVYHGWLLVFTLAVTETTARGILYSAFTVFLMPLEAEFGWSRADSTGAFSIALQLSGIAGIPVGHWLDRHGPRLLMTFSSCTASLYDWLGNYNPMLWGLLGASAVVSATALPVHRAEPSPTGDCQ